MRRIALVIAALWTIGPARAEERTWTIATNVITAKAELVAVRGDIAYLKIGDKVEEYPIVRLSAADQRYIASLSLAPLLPTDVSPVMPGPGDELPMRATAGTSPNTILPTPGGNEPIIPPVLIPPATNTNRAVGGGVPGSSTTFAPAVTEEAIPLPSGTTTPKISSQINTTRSSNYATTAPPSTLSNQTQYRTTTTGQLNTSSNNLRRNVATQSSQKQPRQTTQQNQPDPPGLLNLRARFRDR